MFKRSYREHESKTVGKILSKLVVENRATKPSAFMVNVLINKRDKVLRQ